MSRRRESGNAVSLFPCLAVLICAMGALIFLMLVTTRRLRERAIEQVLSAVVEPESRGEPDVPSAEHARETTPAETTDAETPISPLLAPEPGPSESELAALELRREWETAVNELEAEHVSLSQRLTALGREHERRSGQSEQISRRLHAAIRERDALVAQGGEAEVTLRRLQQQRTEVSAEITRLRAQTDEVRAERAAEAGRFSIVPYDGRSGTTRRPIVIECLPDRVTFASEGITLTAEELDGFTPALNPLLAGAAALMQFWEAHDRLATKAPDTPGKPYVLLIVRPGGTVGYYVARKLLEKLDEPYGYELVTDQQQFAWPETDPQAVAQCRQAIDALLQQRQRLLAQTTSGRLLVAAPLQFVGPHGEFHLEEVERLRGSSQSVYFGGQQWSRQSPRGASDRGTPATEPQGSGSEAGAPGPLTAAANARAFGAPVSSTATTAGEAQSSFGKPASDGIPASAATANWSRTPGGSGKSGASGDEESPASVTRPTPASGRPLRTRHGLDPEHPQFGLRAPGSAIGLERDVTIDVDSQQVRIAREAPIEIVDGMSREELQLTVAEVLDAHVRSWGTPPKGFHWRPALRFKVHPGGIQYQQRLEALARQWELRSTVEQVLE